MQRITGNIVVCRYGLRELTIKEHGDMYSKAYMVPNPMTPNQAIFIDEKLCTGCNTCMDVCRTDVLLPNLERGRAPVVMYPDECWFCGCCAEHCPVPGAIRMEYPLNQRVGWKRKETGEYFRIGMKNSPPPNTRPPVGEGEEH
jgi:NAD-dependent dihydropyrimidine dehydrogenase PreA subunit